MCLIGNRFSSLTIGKDLTHLHKALKAFFRSRSYLNEYLVSFSALELLRFSDIVVGDGFGCSSKMGGIGSFNFVRSMS